MRKARRAAARRRRRLRIMFVDEARFGRMKSAAVVLGADRHAARSGRPTRPQIFVCYGAVSPKDGTCIYLIMPTSNTACFQVFLDVLARRFARQDILLVLDGAPNHRGGDLAVPRQHHPLVSSTLFAGTQSEGKSLGRNSRKNLQELCAQSMNAVRAKLKQAILYIERNPKLVRSITFLSLHRQLNLM